MNLYALFRRNFSNDLEKTFLLTETGRSFTYGALDDTSAQYANALRELGVKPGDRVAVQVEKSVESIFLYLACLRLGAIYLPLNPAYTKSEMEYFLGDSTPRVIVAKPGSENLYPGFQILTLGTDGNGTLPNVTKSQSKVCEPVFRSPHDIAAILYTSGTTGRSKGAMLSHENLTSNALTLVEAWKFSSSDTLLHALPLFHTHGLFVALSCVLLSGSRMIFQSKFDAALVLENLKKCTVFMGVPTFYTRLLAHPELSSENTKQMRLFISGSAPLLAETHREFKERTGHEILERYGMTETTMLCSNPYEGKRVPGSVGLPLPGVEVRIADSEGRALPQGETGVIEVRGPNVFHGYWQMPEKTKQEFRADGFFITGDVGKIDEQGYVHILGRAKDLIISGGFNVYPKEIESVVDALPGVQESAAIGVPHPDFGEAVVVVATTKIPLEEAIVIRHCKEHLANFKTPKRVIFVEDLPRNAMGKVQKNILREKLKSLF